MHHTRVVWRQPTLFMLQAPMHHHLAAPINWQRHLPVIIQRPHPALPLPPSMTAWQRHLP